MIMFLFPLYTRMYNVHCLKMKIENVLFWEWILVVIGILIIKNIYLMIYRYLYEWIEYNTVNIDLYFNQI
jgi:hypothetical protein